MSQSTPRDVGHVQQTIHAVEIDKRAEVRDVFDRANNTVAEVHAFQEFLALFAALLFDHLAPAEHDVLSVVIESNDFEIISVPDELLQILWWNDIDLRCRQKCFHADVHHQAAFDHRSHFTFDQAVTLKNGNDLVPVLAVGCFLLREHYHAFFVLQPFQENIDLVANLQRLGIFKFAQRNDTLGLISDIDEHFARANFQNLPFDDASFSEVWHRLRHHVLHVNHKVSRPPPAQRRSKLNTDVRASGCCRKRKWGRYIRRFRASGQLTSAGYRRMSS